MDFDLSEEHLSLRQMVREFAEQEIAPGIDKLDATEEVPYDLIRKAARLGISGLVVSKEYGGKGADMLSCVIALEELARCDASIVSIIAGSTILGGSPLRLFGTEAQKLRWLVPLARGEILGAIGVTEPEAGSDTAALTTRAVLENGEWVINGAKEFISNSGTEMSAFVTITAVTGETDGRKEISNIVVPRGTPGYTQADPYKKMGYHLMHSYPLVFADCRVPEENLLGVRGQGLRQALHVLSEGRVAVAAMALGIAQGSYDICFEYARKKTWAGQPLSRSQAIQFKLVDMATEIELCRLMIYKAAVLQSQGKPFSKEASMAKLYASELSVKAADVGVGILGIDSQVRPINRFFRNAKLQTLGEGTSEIQRLVLAKVLGC